MRILVTGHAGFIGQHLITELQAAGHEVRGIDWSLNRANDLKRDGVARRMIAATRPSVVVHLAAQVGRVFGEDDPGVTIQSNALMTAMVAKACHAAPGVRLVYCSTSEVYGDNGTTVCREDTGPYRIPHNLYGLSKRWGEEAAALYMPPAGLQVFRPSMPYGPGLPAGRGRAAIVNMLHQAYRGKRMPVHRDAERSWCWIGDTVHAMRLVIEQGDVATSREEYEEQGIGVYNIGRDDAAVSMLHVAEVACRLAGTTATALVDVVDAPANQTTVKRLSMEKLAGLGWTPSVELTDGMHETAVAMGLTR